MRPRALRLGVCSWSLQPANARELAERVRLAGLGAVQLALDPVRTGAMPLLDVESALGRAGIDVVSGMMAMAGEDYSTLASIRRTGGVVPDATWPANEVAAANNARLARVLGIRLVTFHAGFIPHDPVGPRCALLVARVRRITQLFAAEGVRVALETGQEDADTLLELLHELRPDDVGVNFDPANMILYGMGDPVAALRRLAPYVRQVHIKDALPSASRAGRGSERSAGELGSEGSSGESGKGHFGEFGTGGNRGEWGTEVPIGEGAVDWAAFFRTLHDLQLPANLLIERESGTSRLADVSRAAELVGRLNAGELDVARG